MANNKTHLGGNFRGKIEFLITNNLVPVSEICIACRKIEIEILYPVYFFDPQRRWFVPVVLRK